MTDVIKLWDALRLEHQAWVLSHPGAVAHADALSRRRRWVDRRPVEFGMASDDVDEIACWAYDFTRRVPVIDGPALTVLATIIGHWPKQ